MKIKKIFTFLVLALTVLALVSCGEVTVKFESNGGSSVADITLKGILEAPTAPTKEGYTFGGWYSDAALTVEYEFGQKVSDAITLYAKWTINTYEVKFEIKEADGSSAPAPATQNVEYNKTATKPSLSITGYTVGYYSDAALSKEYKFTEAVVGNTTVYVKLSRSTYTVSFVVPGTELTFDSIGFKHGEYLFDKVTAEMFVAEGYKLDSLYLAYVDEKFDGIIVFTDLITVTKDTTIYVKMVEEDARTDGFDINLKDQASGAVIKAGEPKVIDGKLTLLAHNTSGDAKIDTHAITLDQVEYSVAYNTSGGGTYERRCVQFTTDGAGTLTLYVKNGSSGANTLTVHSALNTPLLSENLPYALDAGGSAGNGAERKIVVEIPRAGTYSVFGESGGIRFYRVAFQPASKEESLRMYKEVIEAELVAYLATYKETNYEAANWTTLTGVISTAKTDVAAAGTIAAVDAIVAKAHTDVEAVAPKFKAEKDAAGAALAAELAKYTETDYSAACWTIIQGIYNKALADVVDAQSTEAITSIVTTAATDLAAVETATELAAALDDILLELDEFMEDFVEADYSEANWEKLQGYYTAVISKIEEAQTIEDANNLLNLTMASVDNVMTKAEEEAQAGGPTTISFNANDLTLQNPITSTYTYKEFTFTTISGSNVKIETNSKSFTYKDVEMSFTQRWNSQGGASIEDKSIKFTVNGPGTLNVICLSSSSSNPRNSVLLNELGTAVYTGNADVLGEICLVTIEIKTAGTYYFGSSSSGMCVYYMEFTTNPTEATAISFNANDLTLQNPITSTYTYKEFTFTTISGSNVKIETNSKSFTYKDVAMSFTQRWNSQGGASIEDKSIKFTVNGPGTLNVICLSSSSSNPRNSVLLNELGTAVYTGNADVLGEICLVTIEIKTAGTYYFGSSSSGMCVYYLEFVPGTPATPTTPEA